MYQVDRVGLCQVQKPISVSGGGAVMAFTQGRYQPEILCGPYWRPAPLTGITMAGAAAEGRRLTAAQGAQVPVRGGIPGGWMSGGARPARTA